MDKDLQKAIDLWDSMELEVTLDAILDIEKCPQLNKIYCPDLVCHSVYPCKSNQAVSIH